VCAPWTKNTPVDNFDAVIAAHGSARDAEKYGCEVVTNATTLAHPISSVFGEKILSEGVTESLSSFGVTFSRSYYRLLPVS
jgi:hypothetical protein